MQERYKEASPKEKTYLLDEMEAVTGLHRKSLIRLMNSPFISTERKPRSKQRGPVYGAKVKQAISVIAKALDYPTAERLKPVLVSMALHLAAHDELEVDDRLLEKLEKISESTLKRILAKTPRDKPRSPTKKPSARRAFLRDIPAERIRWDEKEPGHFEVDLVHHCGPTASGEYVCTIQMVDVATGWVELRAVLGRSYLVMQDAFLQILKRLPFAIKEIHPDNGSEFFNHNLLRFWRQNFPHLRISRSRP